MCGIAGVVGGDQNLVNRMLDRLVHRGPDARHIREVPEHKAVIGHLRLSIIDPDVRSDQPIASPSGRYLLSYNGEIYNYLELRRKLVPAGYKFVTQGDTEVLLYWLIEHGISKLTELDGMFAFCLLDRERGTLLLARDQIGEKPLYYSLARENGERRFAFSSEIPPLLDCPWIDRSLDEEALADFLRFLYTAPPRTLYRGIRELAPGSFVTLGLADLSLESRQYYRLENHVRERPGLEFDQAIEGLRERFLVSISRRLRSDVPLAIYLSGGLDSNAILGAAVADGSLKKLDTFTISYEQSEIASRIDESALAERSAAQSNATNKKVLFSENAPFEEAVERTVRLFGQPFGNPTAMVSDALAAEVAVTHKVALVGDGGDEIMLGYARYKALPLHQRLQVLPGGVRRAMGLVTRGLPERGLYSRELRRIKQFSNELNTPLSQSYLNWVTYMTPAELEHATGRKSQTEFCGYLSELFDSFGHDPLLAAQIVDLKSFVPFNLMQSADRTSMAHSIEVRSPFLSIPFIEDALVVPSRHKIHARWNKPLLRGLAASFIPDFIMREPKRAFQPPIQSYVAANIATLEGNLLSSESRLRCVVSPDYTAEQIAAFRNGSRDNSNLLWGLATLEGWLRLA